jgi:hypothetical protein
MAYQCEADPLPSRLETTNKGQGMIKLRDAAEMVLECFDNDYGQVAKDIALADLRLALKDDKEQLLSALENVTRSLEWAAMVIPDIPPKSEFMESLKEAKAMIERARS